METPPLRQIILGNNGIPWEFRKFANGLMIANLFQMWFIKISLASFYNRLKAEELYYTGRLNM
ncbi:MAG: hypothetical protein A7315_04555 [Candidatus Altiarchaeales archaeon WOR_SM1_79]|nr:MAG: hypothetical protein A7315_04555 [Candidatus Altiarchaeales archaeon WOR_SM1_79]